MIAHSDIVLHLLREIVGGAFAVLTGIAAIWSIVTHQRVYNATIEFLPPQFQDPESSRYAFPAFALSPWVPLPLQKDYVRSSSGFCVMTLCVALSLFAFYQWIFGCLASVAFVVGAFSTFKSRKTYRDNCNRARRAD
jgi:Ca2+/Na+ antiporter